MEPPPCVQNAMMRQTKKPFTYTPGGLDLSEIKSPRMARRLERNANYEGISEPRQQPPPPSAQVATNGPLPPSALAVMQPQMHVQVFPSGPAQALSTNKAPPPPPPPTQVQNRSVPPPPPPIGALPTQKVCVDNQVLERPDMTKIIPENPMALLKKTGGPRQRNTFLEEVYKDKSEDSSPVVQQQWSPPVQQQQRSPPVQQQWSPPALQQQRSPPVQQQWSPPAQQQQRSPPVQQQWSPPTQQQQKSPPIQQQRNSFPVQQQKSPPSQHYQQNPSNQWSAPPQQQKSPPIQQSSPYQPPIIERQTGQPAKSTVSGLGSLYIPTSNQQQKGPTTPPEVPKRDPNIQSPGTPTLKEAPKPWQKHQTTQQVPTWAKRDNNIQTEQNSAAPQNEAHPNAVYVTQPLVFQHPGVPQSKNQPQGGIIITAHVPNSKQPPTPERLARQQSWNSNPTQSNAFKIIQKITQTDNDDDYDDGPAVEHPPKYPQEFQQTPPIEQMRKMKMMEGDRDLMGRFKQDEDSFLYNEVDPRYRGAAIPSKAFKLLQSMTDGTSNDISVEYVLVPRSPPTVSNGGPRVRTIPIQIEGDDKPRKYVHPSEQTVPEPKKYTGSSIPSRSFKILQAMTAPDNCANANEVNENNNNPHQWGSCYDPNYSISPYPPLIYLPSPQNQQKPCQSPVFWGYMPILPPTEMTPRGTPLPFWGYHPYYQPNEENKEETCNYLIPYPCYFCCGYPPMTFDNSSTENKVNKDISKEEEESVKLIDATLTKCVWEDQSNSESESESDSSSATETEEIEETNANLPAIRSVKDIKIYDNSDQEEEEDDDSSISVIEEEIPDQLSVIFEDSEKTDDSKRESSILSDITTIPENSDEEISANINIKLPNKLCLTYKIEEEQSEIYTSFTLKSPCVTPLKNRSLCRFDSEEKSDGKKVTEDVKEEVNVSVISNNSDSMEEMNDKENEAKEENNSNCMEKVEDGVHEAEEEEKDWWEILKKDEDVVVKRKPVWQEKEECDSSSTSDSSDESTCTSEELNEDLSENIEETERLLTIKERIQALNESVKQKELKINETEILNSVKEKISVIEENKVNKSFEEFSEEEVDSGVTSDLSRSEEFPELKKMTKYQRAATHSRLFKLLQNECNEDKEENDDKFSKLSVRQRNCCSEMNSALDDLKLNPENDRLVSELVQCLLLKKKGEMFRNLSKEKLELAARKILCENTKDDLFLKNETLVETAQEFYNYKQYYDTWNVTEDFDILPSKTFKLFQDSTKSGTIVAYLAKCPKILSSKNLLKLLENPENPSSNDVTS